MKLRRTALMMCMCTLLLAGCGVHSSLTANGPDSRLGSDRLNAIRAPQNAPDANSIRNLIEQLDHADPSVRLVAITQLSEVVGSDFGFDATGSVEGRDTAIGRWVHWYRSTYPESESVSSSGNADA